MEIRYQERNESTPEPVAKIADLPVGTVFRWTGGDQQLYMRIDHHADAWSEGCEVTCVNLHTGEILLEDEDSPPDTEAHEIVNAYVMVEE